VRPPTRYVNSFGPLALGSYSSSAVGTRVEVIARMNLAVIGFMTIWLSGAGAFLIAGLIIALYEHNHQGWLVAIVGSVFFLFAYGFMTLAFSLDLRRTKRFLELLLVSGVPADELPKADLSWLFAPRLELAEFSERRFNRVFVALYTVSGVLMVFAWGKTITACSNAQSSRPHEFSCPSGARITLTWALFVVLIASGFAARFAIHRRSRVAYAPLVSVLLVIAATAIWLIVCHARWGVPT